MDRLASPEQLDKMIRIASPSLWIAVAGAGLVVLSVLLWAIFGKLPDNVSINGLYMSNTGVQGVYASYGGTVSEILAEKDMQVEAGDVVAVVTNEDSARTIQEMEERISAVEAVTLTSKNDLSTSDNSQLLEYKLQYQQAGMTREQKEESLKALKEQLARAKEETALRKSAMDAAESAYLASVGDDGMNSATFQYQKAQTELSDASSKYQTIYNSVATLESSYSTASQSLQSLYEQYTSLESQYDTVNASYEAQLSQLSQYQSQYESLASQYEGQEIPESVRQQLSSLENSIAALETSSASLKEQLGGLSGSMGQLSESISSASAQVNTYESQLSQAKANLSSAQAALDAAQAAYDAALSTYGSYYTSQGSRTANQTALSTAFNEAATLYSNAYSTQESLEKQIESMSLETGFEVDNENISKDTLKEKFDATKEALIKDLQREQKKLQSGAAVEEIKTQVSGTVVDCAVEENQFIGQGALVVKIKSGTDKEGMNQIVRCYVPIAEGKKLSPGMSVVVTPSTVNEQEYGHMMATVESVGTYTVTTSEMQQVLGDEIMVSANQQQGPCVEVLISLEEDETTASGYAWSNKKGETVALEENTPVSAKVRIKENAPITKLIPFLKSKLDVTVNTQATGN